MTETTLRPETGDDEPFLRRLFFAVRGGEFAPLGLAPQQLDMMLGMQFQAQRNQYRTTFPDGEARIVEIDGEPIGRIFVGRWEGELHLVDVALLPGVKHSPHREGSVATMKAVTDFVGDVLAGVPQDAPAA